MSEMLSQVEPSVMHIRCTESDITAPDRTRVAKLAYELWQQRGSGSPVDNWLEAERLLRGDSENPVASAVTPVPASL